MLAALRPVLASLLYWVIGLSGSARGASLPTPADRTPLPQRHAYQRVLRDYLAQFTEQDFAHGVTGPLTVTESSADVEEKYRTYSMTLMHQPLIGWKRGTPAVNAPSRLFLLTSIEGPLTPPSPAEPLVPPPRPDPLPATFIPVPLPTPTGIVVPPVWPETLVAFTEWEYAGNPYFGNVPLRRRAFVTAAVQMMMLDEHLESSATNLGAGENAQHLISYGDTYRGVQELLPEEVRSAYRDGLLRLGRRLLKNGVTGDNRHHDLASVIGLAYVAQASGDADFAAEVEKYARRLLTDPQYLHPAGYWIDRGNGLDVGFAGTSNFYAVWAALMTDWDFVSQVVERNYRLRAHLCFPEPNGDLTGPSHFNARLGVPACGDQWHWDGARERAAAMITDEAAYLLQPLTTMTLDGAANNRVSWFNFQIKQNPVRPDTYGRKSALKTGYWKNEELAGRTWTWRPVATYNFPISINVPYQFYRPGAYEHLQELSRSRSPLLRSPYLRDETFVRNFADAFVAVKQSGYASLLHTGPVGKLDAEDGRAPYPGPLGFGGGQLSAFWTKECGAVLLGRRGGQSSEQNYDAVDGWRQWPIHAVSGCTTTGKVFTSARIFRPEVAVATESEATVVNVAGVLPQGNEEQGPTLVGRIEYRRVFRIEPNALQVTTTFSGDGRDQIDELYETLPVFLHDRRREPHPEPTRIELLVGEQVTQATTDWTASVTAVRLHRFRGIVQISFAQPQRVKLSPEVWSDSYLTRAMCRNLLIDLTPGADRPVTIKGPRMLSYRIEPQERPVTHVAPD